LYTVASLCPVVCVKPIEGGNIASIEQAAAKARVGRMNIELLA
jgi:hypothetical protein